MKEIVISGSMAFVKQMKNYAQFIEKSGVITVLPNEDKWDTIAPEQVNKYKRKVSRDYFEIIANKSTFGILVVNEEKNGIQNYIGANSFAEITIAFYKNKKIFLLNDFYPPYVDELKAWGAIPLYGNITELIKYLS